jgi:hypothetical protein
MPYEIKNETVLYNGKTVSGACADSFQIGDRYIGWDAKQVYFFGKPRAIDSASFEYLDANYSKDATSVYCLRGTHIITLGKADPKTFKVIAYGYGYDHKRVFLFGKWMSGARPDSFRVFDSRLSVDNKWVFLGTQKVLATKKKFAACDIRRLFADYDKMDYLLSLVVVTDKAVWVKHGNGAELERLEEADPKTFQILGCGCAKDVRHFYANFRVLPGFSVDRLRSIYAPTVWTDDTDVVLEGEVMPGADPQSFIHAFGGYYVDNYQGYRLGRLAFCMDSAPLSDQNFKAMLQSVVRRLANHFMAVFDSWLPICEPSRESDGKLLYNTRYPLPEIDVTLKAGVLSLYYQGNCFKGSLAAIDVALSQIWALQRYATPFRRYVHEYGRPYPSGKILIDQTIRVGGKELIQLANTLFLREYPEDARLLAAWLPYLSLKPETLEDLISGFSPRVFSTLPPILPPSKTASNLARAKEVVASEQLSDPDVLVRHRAYLELYSLFYDTCKEKTFLTHIVPSLLKQLAYEKTRSLRDACLSILDLMVTVVFRLAHHKKAYYYKEAYPLIKLLIEDGFNLDLNLLRGLECARVLGDKVMSETLTYRVENTIPKDRVISGISTVLQLTLSYPNREFWLLDSELRIAAARGEYHNAQLVSHLLHRLDKLRMIYGYQEALDNYHYLMASLNHISPKPLFTITDINPTNHRYAHVKQVARSATFKLGGFRLLSQGEFERYTIPDAPTKTLFRLKKSGSRFTKQKGDFIGLEYMPEGFPWGRYLNVAVVVSHPPIEGNRRTRYPDNQAGLGIRNGFYWHFETEQECVSGIWRISLEYEGESVLEVQFDILEN